MASRGKVLDLYRRIFQTARSWPKADEAAYIRSEARTLFNKNKHISDPELVEKKLFEGESRLQMAIHYKIPYPRMSYAPPNTREGQLASKRIKQAYMDSYEQ